MISGEYIMKLVLFGAGSFGKLWLEKLGADKIYCFADSNKSLIGKTIMGKRILSVEELINMKDDIKIFITPKLEIKKEIYNILKSKGLKNNVVGYPFIDKEIYLDIETEIDIHTEFEGRNAALNGVILNECKVGYASYISSNTVFDNVKIGKFSSIGPNIRVIRGQHPTRDFVSTHPIFYSTQQTIQKSFVTENLFDELRCTKGGYALEIGNDVWIGNGATIMEGIYIADGTIIASGANVVKDTSPYSIVGGNPAKMIRYRFDKYIIKFLMDLQWWNKSEEWLENHAKYFVDIEKLLKVISEEKKTSKLLGIGLHN